MDHTEYLGDTYEKIAFTKGGIIKDCIPFVTGEKKLGCLNVFKELCQQHHSQFIKVQDIQNIEENKNTISFDYATYHVVLQTGARYQCENSALAIEILLYLKNNGYIILNKETLLEGLRDAVWEGRFEVVCDKPLMIIDGAHNKEGIEAFYQSAKKYQNIKIIFSALRDKDTHAMIEKLLKLKGMMMTEAGKKEAKHRHEIMVSFLYHYFEEENVPEWREYLDNYLKLKI